MENMLGTWVENIFGTIDGEHVRAWEGNILELSKGHILQHGWRLSWERGEHPALWGVDNVLEPWIENILEHGWGSCCNVDGMLSWKC